MPCFSFFPYYIRAGLLREGRIYWDGGAGRYGEGNTYAGFYHGLGCRIRHKAVVHLTALRVEST
jgi:hypothetical protein